MEMNLVLGGICIIGGLLTIIFGLLQAQKAKKASQTWSTAEGEILDSHLQKHSNRSSRGVSVTTYSPEVSYRHRRRPGPDWRGGIPSPARSRA